jgi:hypothetical protein
MVSHKKRAERHDSLRAWARDMAVAYESGQRTLARGRGLCAELKALDECAYFNAWIRFMIGLLGIKKFCRYIGQRGRFTRERYGLVLLISHLSDDDIEGIEAMGRCEVGS